MPIYDYNGTTSYEIGKAYDNDGTTTHQIGKVYDNDGTASRIIYSAETWLLTTEEGGDAFSVIFTQEGCSASCGFYDHGNIQGTYKTLNVSTQANQWQWSEAWVSDKKPVNLDGVDTITLKWQHCNGNGIHNICLAVSDTFPQLSNYWSWKGSVHRVSTGDINSLTGGQLVLDVSGISGFKYIMFMSSTSYSTWFDIHFRELRLN